MNNLNPNYWKNKNVLITGIFGFYAPHIAEKLVDIGANIIGSYNDEKPSSYVSISDLDQKITLTKMDINNLLSIQDVLSKYAIDYIFHCAAVSIVKHSIKSPVTCFHTNILGTVNVLEAARLYGNISGIACMESDKSYGSFDEKDLPYREDQKIKPNNVYEVSKACAGLVAQAYENNYSLPVFTIRAANLFGPGDFNVSRLIPGSIIRLLNSSSPILYSGVAKYKREFLYVKDAADIIIMLMEKIKKSSSHIFNLGSGDIFEIESLIKSITEKINPGINYRVVEKESTFKEIDLQYLSLEKIKDFLPNYSNTSFDEGLAETIDWYRQNLHNLPGID